MSRKWIVSKEKKKEISKRKEIACTLNPARPEKHVRDDEMERWSELDNQSTANGGDFGEVSPE